LTSNKIYVVLDTNVAIRALAGLSPHVEALERLKSLCHTAIWSKDVLKEYQSRVNKIGMTGIILLTRLASLEQIGKLERCFKTLLDRAQRTIREEHLPLPNDRTDTKFLKLAIAKKASYIITSNGHLLNLNPYRYSASSIKIVVPEDYPDNN